MFVVTGLSCRINSPKKEKIQNISIVDGTVHYCESDREKHIAMLRTALQRLLERCDQKAEWLSRRVRVVRSVQLGPTSQASYLAPFRVILIDVEQLRRPSDEDWLTECYELLVRLCELRINVEAGK
jgi:hypothetical protein